MCQDVYVVAINIIILINYYVVWIDLKILMLR